MEIKHYTKGRIPDVLNFERDLRAEENFWGWEIDEKYIADVTKSFGDPAFARFPVPACIYGWEGRGPDRLHQDMQPL